MPGAEWFPGARLNYAQNVLKNERPGEIALYHHSESAPVTPLYWDELGKNVRILATRLRDLGVRPGDRVASCLPSIPQAVIAMLATTSIGAIWTSVSPDFGWRGMLDRPPVEAADFEFHHGPFSMPIWILFSSGTTGLPKAITHSHGGIMIEQLKSRSRRSSA